MILGVSPFHVETPTITSKTTHKYMNTSNKPFKLKFPHNKQFINTTYSTHINTFKPYILTLSHTYANSDHQPDTTKYIILSNSYKRALTKAHKIIDHIDLQSVQHPDSYDDTTSLLSLLPLTI